MAGSDTVADVRAALEREARVDLHHNDIRISCDGSVVTLDGVVDNIAAKKLSLELAAAIPEVAGVVDRLRVFPAEPMEDGAIRDHICDSIAEESSFREYSVRSYVKGTWERCREFPGETAGSLDIEVNDGVVTLNGTVGSLSHKRLAGVLAWWVPGSRDVINGLEVAPAMADNDDEVADAVRLALEKDPFVNASQVKALCRNYIVTLDGIVAKPKERDMAEADAWYVFRVNNVVNRIEVEK